MSGGEAAGLLAFVGALPLIIGSAMAGCAYVELAEDRYLDKKTKREFRIGIVLASVGAALALPGFLKVITLVVLS